MQHNDSRVHGALTFCAVSLLASATALAAPPANDTCASATPLSLGVPITASTAEATSDIAESPCGFNDDRDVWFSFTSTEFNNFRIRVDPASALDTTLAIYLGCSGTLLACNDDATGAPRAQHWSSADVQLSPSQTILIRVAGWNHATGSFTLTIDHIPLPHPANDECSAATVVAFPSSTNSTTVGATGTDITSCGEDDFFDTWYDFTAPADGTYHVFVTNTDIFGLFLAAYPSCSGPEMSCGLRELNLRIVAGQRVLIRAAFNGGVAGDFTLNVGPLPAIPVPANDDCPGALPLLGPGTYQGSTAGATGFDTGYIFGCTLSDTGPGVWYQFTAPAPGVYQFDTSGSDSLPSGLADTTIVLFGSCAPGGGTDLRACDDNLGIGLASRVLWQASAPGDTVYICIAGQHRTTGPFQLTISTNLTGPPNDTCAAAISITSPSITPGNDFLASNIDIYPSVCDDGFFPLFYSFVAPADATYLFDVLDSPDLPYAAVALYDSCGGHQLACNPDRAVRLAMRAGDSVIVRVSGSLSYRGPFNLRVSTEEPGPANDSCASAALIAFGASIHATNRGATGSSATGNCSSSEATGPSDVWYDFVAPAAGTYTFTATGFIRPGLSLFTDCWPAASDAIACALGCQAPASIALPLSAGDHLKIRVSPCFGGFSGLHEFGAFTLTVGSTTVGACCTSSTCRLAEAAACAGASSHFSGPGTACAASSCCRADFNHSGALSVQDIFDFLSAWFASDPAADFNGSGLSVGDIFDFLAAWFTGC